MDATRFIRNNKQQIGALVCLLVIFGVLGLINPFIFQIGNILNIGKQASINLIIALGMTVVILSGGIDLSVGSLLALLVVVSGRLSDVEGWGMPAALCVGVLCTVLAGLVNGLVIHYGRVPPFVATLGSLGVVRGVALIFAQGHPGMSFPTGFLKVADGTIAAIPVPIVIAIATTAVIFLLLRYTVAGRSFYALGGNEEAARLSGVNIARARVLPYVISAICCAIGGVVFAARVGAAPPGAGQGYELAAIASVVIGGTPLTGGTGTILGSAIGALLIAVIQNGLTILNVDPYWQGIIVGTIIILAVMISAYRR